MQATNTHTPLPPLHHPEKVQKKKKTKKKYAKMFNGWLTEVVEL